MATSPLIVAVAAISALYLLYGVINRLFLSPIAKIPGPRLAALTGWYEVYYDIVKPAVFPWHLQKLHAKYGPVVRISPWEVHISDPSYASTHFSGSLKLDKLKARQEWFGVPQASITTPDHDLHRIRHTAISPFFSKKQISKLEPIIASKVTKCCTQLAKYAKDGAVLDLRLLFTCYTTDVVTEYVLASSYNLLDSADLTPQWRETFNSVLRNGHFFKHFPICWKILRAIPYNTIVKMSPDMKLVLDFEIDVKRSAKQAMERDTTSTDTKAPSHPIVFTELLQSDLPPAEKSYDRLWNEAGSLIAAGTETTANTLVYILYTLLTHPTALSRLRKEINSLPPPPSTSQTQPLNALEKLPFLTAVIQEGLRCATPTVARTQRISWERETKCGKFVFPPGTVVSMDMMTLNGNEDVFESPEEWRPERWLNPPTRGGDQPNQGDLLDQGPTTQGEKGKGLGREVLWSFSKGPRMCVGINLAYAEMYLALGAIIPRFDMKLFETTDWDIEGVYDGFVPMPRIESKGIRVSVGEVK